VLMPRLMSEVLGLHPLLVFAAILLGVKIGGFWGAFFGIPIAGVIWAMLVFFYEMWIKGRAQGNEPQSMSPLPNEPVNQREKSKSKSQESIVKS
jgi:predicted PurR-regulated permease PerM